MKSLTFGSPAYCDGDAAEADALGLPRGGVGAAELFARYPAGAVGQGL